MILSNIDIDIDYTVDIDVRYIIDVDIDYSIDIKKVKYRNMYMLESRCRYMQ